MSERKKRIAVVGVGNILMGDEGIGVKAVAELERKSLPEGIELFDGGTAFHALIGELANFDKLVIADAVRGGEPPGTIYRFELKQTMEGEAETKRSLSLHDIGVVETLMLERLVQRIPEEIVFIGIEPQRVELSMELSPILEERLPVLVQAILGELKTHAICKP